MNKRLVIIILLLCSFFIFANYSFAQRFIDNGDGTVTDLKTGLMWQQGSSEEWRFYWDAFPCSGCYHTKYLNNLSLGGHNNWRLPTIYELKSLIDRSQTSPYINKTYFPETNNFYYISSTINYDHWMQFWGNEVYFSVDFRTGTVSEEWRGYIRAVRNIQTLSINPEIKIIKPEDSKVFENVTLIPFNVSSINISNSYKLKAFLKKSNLLISDSCTGNYGENSFSSSDKNCFFLADSTNNGVFDLYVLACTQDVCDLEHSPHDHVQFTVKINPPTIEIKNPKIDGSITTQRSIRFQASANNFSENFRLKAFLKKQTEATSILINEQCMSEFGVSSLPNIKTCQFPVSYSENGIYDLFVLACTQQQCSTEESPYNHVQFKVDIQSLQPQVTIQAPESNSTYTSETTIMLNAYGLNISEDYRLKAFLKKDGITVSDYCISSFGENVLPNSPECQYHVDSSLNGEYELFVLACTNDICSTSNSPYAKVNFTIDIEQPEVTIHDPHHELKITSPNTIRFKASANRMTPNYKLKTFLKMSEESISQDCFSNFGDTSLPDTSDCDFKLESTLNGKYDLYVLACTEKICNIEQSPHDHVVFNVAIDAPQITIQQPVNDFIIDEESDIQFQATASNMSSMYRLKAFLQKIENDSNEKNIADECFSEFGESQLPLASECSYHFNSARNGRYALYVMACTEQLCDKDYSPFLRNEFTVNIPIKETEITIDSPEQNEIIQQKGKVELSAIAKNLSDQHSTLKGFVWDTEWKNGGDVHKFCKSPEGQSELKCELEIDATKNGLYYFYVLACSQNIACDISNCPYDLVNFIVNLQPEITIKQPENNIKIISPKTIIFSADAENMNDQYRLKSFLKKHDTDNNDVLIHKSCMSDYGASHLPSSSNCKFSFNPSDNGTYELFVLACKKNADTCDISSSPYDSITFEVDIEEELSQDDLKITISRIAGIDYNKIEVTYKLECSENALKFLKNIYVDFDNNDEVDIVLSPVSQEIVWQFEKQDNFSTIVIAKSDNGQRIQKSINVDTRIGSATLNVYAYNSNTESFVSNASVRLANQELDKLPDGYWQLNEIIPGEYILEVHAEGYNNYERNIDIVKGVNNETVYMSNPLSSEYPRIDHIHIFVEKGTSFLKYREVKKPIFLSGVYCNVLFKPEVDWGAIDPEIINLYLSNNSQDDLIYASYPWTEDIELNGIQLNIGQFEPGTSLCFEIVNVDGETSGKVCAEMKMVTVPLSDSPLIWRNGKYISEISYLFQLVNESVSIGQIPEPIPFIGNQNIAFFTGMMVENIVDTNGNGSIKLPLIPDTKCEFLIKDINVDVSSSVYIQVGMQYDDIDQSWNYDGGAGFSIGGQLKTRPYYVWFKPPIYARLALGITNDVSLNLIRFQKVNDFLTSVTPIVEGRFVISPYGEIIGGVGIADITHAEITGKAKLDWIIPFPKSYLNKEKLLYTLDLSANIRILFFVHKISIANCDGDVLNNTFSCGYSKKSYDQSMIVSSDEFQLLNRDYINATYEYRPKLKKMVKINTIDEKPVEIIIMENVYPFSDVSMITNNNQLKIFAISDDPNRSSANRTILRCYDLNENGRILNTVTIEDNQTSDFHPTATSLSDGTILVVWNDLKTVLEDTATLEDALSVMEIASSVYNSYSSNWQSLGHITNNDYLDKIPSLSPLPDNSVLAVWISNKGNLYIADENYPDLIFASFFINGSWSQPVQIAEGQGPVIRVIAGQIDGKAAIIWEVDVDNDISSFNDRELMCSRYKNGEWQSTEQLTNNDECDTYPVMTQTKNGKSLLAWGKGDQIVCADVNQLTQIVIVDSNADLKAIDDFAIIPRPSGGAALIWKNISENLETDLFISMYDENEKIWGETKKVTQDKDWERDFSGIYNNQENLFLAYNKVRLKEDPKLGAIPDYVDLAVLKFKETIDIQAISIELSNDKPSPGEQIEIRGYIKNNGDHVIHDIPVSFLIGDTLISTYTATSHLAPGNIQKFTSICTLPQSNGVTLTLQIDRNNKLNDNNHENNSISISVIKPDILSNGLNITTLPEGQMLVSTQIFNQGAVESSGFSIVLAQINFNRETIYQTKRIDELQTSELLELQWTVPTGKYVLYLDADEEVSEENENNNKYSNAYQHNYSSVMLLPPDYLSEKMLHFEIYIPFSISDEISNILWDMNNDGLPDVQTQQNYLDYEYETYGNYKINVVIHLQNGNEVIIDPISISVKMSFGDTDSNGKVELKDAIVMMQMMTGLRSSTQLLIEDYNTVKLKELLFILKNLIGLTTIHE